MESKEAPPRRMQESRKVCSLRRKYRQSTELSSKVQIYASTFHKKPESNRSSYTLRRYHHWSCKEAKYLGVIFEKNLRFRAQLNLIIKKGTNFASAIIGISHTKWGLEFEHLRRLFNAVAAPRMDYAAIIWHRPKDNGKALTVGQISRISAIQRQIMKAILGCFRTTSTTALEIETALTPPKHRLCSKILHTVTRLQATSFDHPIQQWINRALHNGGGLSHESNLENLINHFPEYFDLMIERIQSYVRSPWWTLRAAINIELNKDSAELSHNVTLAQATQQNSLVIYTDGSGINGRIGAATYSPTNNEISRKHLGTEAQFNVYGAELKAINSATEQARKHARQYRKCIIFADSQAAIKAIAKPRRQSEQSIIKKILNEIDAIHRVNQDYEIQFQWVLGHQNIPGNERADEEAKKAALASASDEKFPEPNLRSAKYQLIRSKLDQQWRNEWNKGTENARQLRYICRSIGVIKSEAKIYQRISDRKHIAWIARLRTEHCSLNKYLHHFGTIDSLYCECEGGHETVTHYLLKCEIYEEERDALRRKVRVQEMRVKQLLGDSKLVKHTLEFMERTQRFNF